MQQIFSDFTISKHRITGQAGAAVKAEPGQTLFAVFCHSKEVLPCVQVKLSVCQPASTVPCSVTGHQCKEPALST